MGMSASGHQMLYEEMAKGSSPACAGNLTSHKLGTTQDRMEMDGAVNNCTAAGKAHKNGNRSRAWTKKNPQLLLSRCQGVKGGTLGDNLTQQRHSDTRSRSPANSNYTKMAQPWFKARHT